MNKRHVWPAPYGITKRYEPNLAVRWAPPTVFAFSLPLFYVFGHLQIGILLCVIVGLVSLYASNKYAKQVDKYRPLALPFPQQFNHTEFNHQLWVAVESNEFELIPLLPPGEVRSSAQQVNDELKVAAQHVDALIDFPEHLAVIRNVSTVYFPDTVRAFTQVPHRMRNQAATPTLNAFRVLGREVQRINTAIEDHQLSQLDTHRALLGKMFGDQNHG